ncbi:MAG TPA: TIR domain-containing protein [Acidimicrobiales bacterium]
MSYSRLDAPKVKVLAKHLHEFGQEAWLDEELSGGQRWWDTILRKIRDCDCLVFAQSRSSCASVACMRELEYAYRLGKPILPVLVGDPMPDELLPPFLAETQRVDARDVDTAVVPLGRAILSLPPSPPLPDPLPDPPLVPVSYMTELTKQLDKPELTLREQRDLLADLRHALNDEDEADGAAELLRRLRARPDVLAVVAADIDSLLLAHAPAGPFPQRPNAPPTPSGPAPTPTHSKPKRSRVVTVLAVVGGLFLTLMLIAAFTGGFEDDDPPSQPGAVSTGVTDEEVLDQYFSNRHDRCLRGLTAEFPNCGFVLDSNSQQEWLVRHGYVACRDAGRPPEECVLRLPTS